MYNVHAFIVLCKATTLLSKRRFKKINMFINMPICLSELVLVCNSNGVSTRLQLKKQTEMNFGFYHCLPRFLAG